MQNVRIEDDEAVVQGMIDLFFPARNPIGRRYPHKMGANGKVITGPWREWYDTEDGERASRLVDLTPKMMLRHINGDLQGPEQIMLMAYQTDADGASVATAIDLDVVGEEHADTEPHFKTPEAARKAVQRLNDESLGLGIRPWIEVTKSGGYRLWVFHHRLPAPVACDFGQLLLKKAKLNKKIEVFPKQRNSPSLTGSGVLVPYYGPNVERGRQVFIEAETGEIIPIREFVTAALEGRSDPADIERIIREAVHNGDLAPDRQAKKKSGVTGDEYLGDSPLHNRDNAIPAWRRLTENCFAIRQLVERSESGLQLSYEEWLKLATHLRAFGEWGRGEFHRLSQMDERYDEIETDTLFDSLSGGPTGCDKMDCALNPQSDCGLPQGRTNAIWFAYSSGESASSRAEAIAREDWSFDKCTPDPNGSWLLTNDGVFSVKVTKDGLITTKVVGQPIYIQERARDLDEKTENVTIVWIERSMPHFRTVSRKTISDSRELLGLADEGLMVNSINARNIVAYLADLLDYHQDNIPITHVVSKCGHKTIDKQKVFMLGSELIAPSEPAPDLSLNPDSDYSGVLEAFRAEGDPDVWLAAARKLGEHPLAAFGVAAAFLPPLLRDLKVQQNPIIDYAGMSSTGKSTILRFIASVWGYPPEGDGGLIRSWNSTTVFLERMANVTNDLPIFLDESHTVNPKSVQDATYQYANGTGRGRGDRKGGVQKMASYRGVLFSAGEQRMAEASQHDGSQARVLGFWGSPFGGHNSSLVRELNQVAVTHYGMAGRQFVYNYLANRDEWVPWLKDRQAEAFQRLMARNTDAIDERLASACAAIEAAGKLANGFLKLNWNVGMIVDAAYDKMCRNRKVSSAKMSMELLGSWLSGREAAGEIAPDGRGAGMRMRQCIGRYIDEGTGARRVAFLQDVLKNFLAQHDYSYSTILSQWADHGWLETDRDRKQKKVQFNGVKTYMVVLSKEGMLAARGYADGETDDELKGMGYRNIEEDDEKADTPSVPSVMAVPGDVDELEPLPAEW